MLNVETDKFTIYMDSDGWHLVYAGANIHTGKPLVRLMGAADISDAMTILANEVKVKWPQEPSLSERVKEYQDNAFADTFRQTKVQS
jgi:hypothetical protein